MAGEAAFAALLKRYRIAAGLTQEMLAERSGISVRAISDLERGVKARPHGDTVRLLATALQLSSQERARLETARQRGTTSLPHVTGAVSPRPGVSAGPPLVGRDRELALLERHLAVDLEDGRRGSPPVLLLAGEPGIGKSRLLHEAARLAGADGWRVLAGGCQRRGGQDLYTPLLQALEADLRAQTPAQRRSSLRGCSWLVRLLPELAAEAIEPLPAWPVAPAQERRLLFGAVGRYLANVAGPSGTLLLLDDLQWADADALDLLATLVRTTGELPLRIIGAYRDSDVDAQVPLASMLADLAQARLATQHTLRPLTSQEAADLLTRLLEDADGAQVRVREQVVQRTGGVPFFLLSCAQELRTQTTHSEGQESVPWDVAQSVRQRVAALSPIAQEVLAVAAVIGRVVSLPVLAAVAAQAELEMAAALDAAYRARLLDEVQTLGAGAYQFVHDIVREVIEADLGAARRILLHRRVADVLEQQAGEPPVERLAYHYARSTEQGKAALYLEQAGDKARAQYARAAAETYYAEAVERLDRLGRTLEAAQVREKLGSVLSSSARHEAALAVLEQAAQTYERAGELEGLRRTLAAIGGAHGDSAAPEEGLARLQPLLPVLETSAPSRGMAALSGALASLYSFVGRYGESVAAAERAVDFARVVQDDLLLAGAEATRGQSLLLLGCVDEALQALEGAIRLAEANDPGDLYSMLMNVAVIHDDGGEFERSRWYAQRARAVAERSGAPDATVATTALQGWTAFHAGDWAQARRDGEQALALSREIELSNGFAFPRVWLGQLCIAEGRWDEAVRYLEEAAALTSRTGQFRKQRWAQGALADIDVRAGNAGAAIARLTPLLDRPGLQEHDVTMFLPVLAEAHLLLDSPMEARQVVAEAIARARAGRLRRALVEGLRVQTLVAIRQRQWTDAAWSLEEGLAEAHSMPHVYAKARLLQVKGELHRGQGALQAAREFWEEALAIFRRLGALKEAEQVAQMLTEALGAGR
jgi:tetratricopeptide (TPR) repeat protein/transcriptional regulator with XRE-family HTH domain